MSSGDFQVLGNYNKTYDLLYAGKLNVLKKDNWMQKGGKIKPKKMKI